jgi:cytosine/adenosine deaminase-related metal-dependent hydrolase
MLEAGCRVALGLDGSALDEDEDALRDLRLAHLLHVGTGFRIAASREKLLRAAFATGRFSVTNIDDGGVVAPGAPADLLLLDWAAIDDDRLRDDLDPVTLVLNRATARHVRELIVGGRTVVKDGAVTGIDLPAARAEVLAQTRAGMAANDALAGAMPALERALAAHFEPECPCC